MIVYSVSNAGYFSKNKNVQFKSVTTDAIRRENLNNMRRDNIRKVEEQIGNLKRNLEHYTDTSDSTTAEFRRRWNERLNDNQEILNRLRNGENLVVRTKGNSDDAFSAHSIEEAEIYGDSELARYDL